jgi:methyl-accepting chemotaxis protein
MSINLDEAVQTHSDWKRKLQNYLANPDGSIDATKLAMDNACTLGQWLYGDGKKFANLPEYNQLVEAHKNFHKSAADIVRRKEGGEDVSADMALGSHSPFAKHSMDVVMMIKRIKRTVENS